MRVTQTLLICGAIALTAMAATIATRAEARVRVGVMIGVPGPWYPHPYYDYPPPYYYPPAYYYRAPTIIVPQAPPTYIQQPSVDQSSAQDAESSANYWYYCAAEKGYYPYVKQCPGGWRRVAPKPSGAP